MNAVNTKCVRHRRLGHPLSEVLSLLPHTLGVVCSKGQNRTEICEICVRAKQTRSPFPISKNNAKAIFDSIHYDICGTYRTSSFCGAYYFLTIVDDASRATWVYLMKDKTEVSKLLK